MTGHQAATTRMLAIAVLIAPLLSGCGRGENETQGAEDQAAGETVRVYGFQSGRITYAIEGLEEGISVAVWDDWGLREAERFQSRSTLGGVDTVASQLSLRTPKGFVMVDLSTKEATPLPNPIVDMISAQDGTEIGSFSQRLLETMGGERTGRDRVAGKECEVWSVPRIGGSLCLWKGLMLRQRVSQGEFSFTKTAARIETDVQIDPSELALPAGVTVLESATP